MAREASISQEQVNAAADAIRGTGGKPTAWAVREQLGSGSMATVLKFFQVWQAGQIKPLAEEAVLPPALTRMLVDYVGQAVAVAKTAIESDLATMQQAQSDLIAESERQAVTITLQDEALTSAQTEVAAYRAKLETLTDDLAAARSDAAQERTAAERARTDIAKAELRLESVPRLEADLLRIQAALDSERRARTEAERGLASAESRAAGVADRLADLQQRYAALEAAVVEERNGREVALIKLATVEARADALKLAAAETRTNPPQTGE